MKRAEIDRRGTLRCPHCGSEQIESRRSVKRMVAFGVAGAGPVLRCLACGRSFKRPRGI